MVTSTVTDLLSLINHQIELNQGLRETLAKATALLHVALEHDVFDASNLALYFYFWSVYDLVKQAQDTTAEGVHKLEIQAQQLGK